MVVLAWCSISTCIWANTSPITYSLPVLLFLIFRPVHFADAGSESQLASDVAGAVPVARWAACRAIGGKSRRAFFGVLGMGLGGFRFFRMAQDAMQVGWKKSKFTQIRYHGVAFRWRGYRK